MRYFKGHSKVDGRHMIFEVYEEPQQDLFDEQPYLIVGSALEKTGLIHYKNYEVCEAANHLMREITEEEYICYRTIQRLLTELYMHDITGGFPDVTAVTHLCRDLPREVDKWIMKLRSN